MTKTNEKIGMITSVQRGQRSTVEQKIRLVEESNWPGMSVSHVGRIHEVAPNHFFNWMRRMAERNCEAFEADDGVVNAAVVRDLRKQVRELQRVLGKKTMGVENPREAVNLMDEKKKISRLLSPSVDDLL